MSKMSFKEFKTKFNELYKEANDNYTKEKTDYTGAYFVAMQDIDTIIEEMEDKK